MVPSFAFDRLEPRDFVVLLRIRLDENQLPILRDHKKYWLIGEQQHLAGAVSSSLPFQFSGRQVDAAEDVSIKAVDMAAMINEVAEIRFDPAAVPYFRNLP